MPLLARRVKGKFWTKADEPALWTNGGFPYEPLTDLMDKLAGGVSLWQVHSSRDVMLRRIAAALVIGGNQIESVEFRTFPRAQAGTLGLTLTQRPGQTKDVGINSLHWEIDNLTGRQAIGLVKRLRTSIVTFSAKEVARFIAESLTKNYMPANALTERLLSDMRKYDAVKIVVPK
jgi:hypothetical protein